MGPGKALILVALVGASACGPQDPPLGRKLVAPDHAGLVDAKASPYLKAHMKDGRLYVFSKWTVNGAARAVSGTGRQWEIDRVRWADGTFDLPLDAVALFETNKPIETPPFVAAMTVVTGVSLAATALCLTNAKACFGSCPTFYVSDGTRPVLQAEGFSDAIAPSLEATDIDALFRARPTERALRVRMTNEALETHVVKEVAVLAVPRPPGGRAFHAAGDGFYPARTVQAPTGCAAPEGSCTAALAAFDGNERFSRADGRDLAAREDLTLTFPPTAASTVGVVIAARQTLLTTFLLYQGLAYLGTQATAALSEVERDPTAKQRVAAAHRVLGGIEVAIEDGPDRWRTVGEAFETGPIATDVHLVRLPVAPREAQPWRVRLRLTRGDWRLDWVAAAALGARLEPVRVQARAVSGVKSDGRPAAPRPGEPIVTMPGDAYDFDFDLPEHPEAHELFLQSRGYYLEWIREPWLAEESALSAAMMMYTPGVALRVLAPAYKRQEAEMDRLFWGSRYAHP